MSAAEQPITENLATWSSAIQTRSAAGRGKSNKLELYGIKKLRELILELAVRGLLVPQDPNDEPASELLKKIAAEKAQLIKEGKLKKPRGRSDEEISPLFDIPASWRWVRLSDIGSIFNGNSVNARTKAEKYTDIDGLPYIATKDIGYGFEPLNYENGISIPFGESKFKIAQQGAVLICSEGGSAGKKCGITDHDICFGNKLYANQLYGDVEPRYILSLYLTPSFFGRFTESMTGIIGGISTAKFMQLPAPIPSIAEQARIVAKVDELMVLCDQLEQQQETSITAHQTLVQTLLDALTTASERDGFTTAWARIADHFDTLFTTEWSIDQLKQTILQLAVMGKLVPQDPNDEPASELLTKIAAEKAQLVKDKKIKKPKALPAIDEDETLCGLPSGWVWTRIADIALVAPRNEASDDDEVSFVPMPLVTTDYDGGHGQQVRQWSEVKKGYTHFADGDFAIAKITPCFENSKAAIFSDLKNGIGAGTTELHVARPYGEFVNRRYVLLYLKAPQFLLVGEGKMTGTAGQKRVPKDFFALNPLPFPPLAEQIRIVAKADELMALCDTLRVRLNTAQATQLKLAGVMAEKAAA